MIWGLKNILLSFFSEIVGMQKSCRNYLRQLLKNSHNFYLAVSPVAPNGTPVTVCCRLKLPLPATAYTPIVWLPVFKMYRYFELLLNAASIGPIPVVAAIAVFTLILPELLTLKFVRLLLAVFVV